MSIRALALSVLLLGLAPLPGPTPLALAQEAPAAATLEELLEASALKGIFEGFGESISSSAESSGMPFEPAFLEAWQAAAEEVFAPALLAADFEARLADRFTQAELEELAVFFRSDFGKQVSAIENEVQSLSPGDQLAARDEGLALLEDLPPDSARSAAIEEALELVGAEMGRAMLGESMRAMMVGIAMSGAQGEIEVPWDEIDAQLDMLLPGLDAEVLASQRGIMAYAYRDLDDAQMEDYLAFLRTDAARRFYGVVGVAAGLVIHDAMARFGETLATRLNRVDV